MTASRAHVPDPAQGPASAGSADPRIILVGRTGLEGKLRPFGPVRVRRALDAIGELADPSAPGDAGTLVVVGPDADPGGGDGGRAGEFVRALRRVEPAVRVVRVGAPAGDSSDVPYDAVISANDTVQSMLAIRPQAARPTPPAPPEPEPQPESREVDSLIEFMLDGNAAAHPGDMELVALMLRGRDILPAAARLLRDRSGDPTLRFVPAEAGAATTSGGTAVAWRGHAFGRLISDLTGSNDLAPHATWLAGWLALAAQQAQLRGEAFTDSLTGAWNRRYFERFMEAALQTAQRDRRHLTILVFDIDDFKQYNDRFGHAAGDSILVETVRLLKSVIRPSDKVCRIGGDEFAVIFHEPDGPRIATSRHPESIYELASRFQRQICAHRFPKLLEQAHGTLTISGGLATFPWDGRSADELLARADQLALQGKRAGKNTIVFGPGAADVCGANEG